MIELPTKNDCYKKWIANKKLKPLERLILELLPDSEEARKILSSAIKEHSKELVKTCKELLSSDVWHEIKDYVPGYFCLWCGGWSEAGPGRHSGKLEDIDHLEDCRFHSLTNAISKMEAK